MTAHRGLDLTNESQVEYERSLQNMTLPYVDVETGATYEILFACLDEQAQTRGGIEGSGAHVVNLQKVEDLEDELTERVDDYFKNLDGVSVETKWSLGDTHGYKDHYVFFKVRIIQSLRSMWDVNIDNMTLGLADVLSDKVKYLQSTHEDRTEEILNATERVQR